MRIVNGLRLLSKNPGPTGCRALRDNRFAMRDRVGCPPALSLRRRLLRHAQAGLYWTGAAAFYARLRPSQSPCILMYHSVACLADASWIAPRNRMSPERFEVQMRFLARHRHVLSIANLVDMIQHSRPIPPRAVLLTFDDGYRDNLDIVAPILQRYHLPAVLYICTGYVSRGENQWADVLYSAIRRRRSDRFVFENGPPYDLGDPGSREAAYEAVARRLLSADCAERDALLKRAVSQLQPDEHPPRQTLTWDAVRRLAAQYPGFALGVHTSDHVDLSSLTVEEALAEIGRSVDEFEAELGRCPGHFSFPYSRAVPQLLRQLRGLGFRSAMTWEGAESGPNHNPFDLRRLEAPRRHDLLGYYTSGAHPALSMKLFRRA